MIQTASGTMVSKDAGLERACCGAWGVLDNERTTVERGGSDEGWRMNAQNGRLSAENGLDDIVDGGRKRKGHAEGWTRRQERAARRCQQWPGEERRADGRTQRQEQAGRHTTLSTVAGRKAERKGRTQRQEQAGRRTTLSTVAGRESAQNGRHSSKSGLDDVHDVVNGGRKRKGRQERAGRRFIAGVDEMARTCLIKNDGSVVNHS
ncbi:hypothetical protein L210DRAFT_3663486 [Boletus edulis BED1]|uniref:Uncharacterized protein n=1 Tax=Boletus edulis BED1 TaxID=1328754 RepID=A0AAD4BVI0_BOLED|nr:hypothetical protein L210DRAFT_3663486 [Boletus edulis BED1]